MSRPELVPNVEDFDEAVLAQVKRDSALDEEGGLLVFLRRWAGSPTLDSAIGLVEKFDLTTELGSLSKLRKKYEENIDGLWDEIEDILESTVVGPLNRASKLAKVGGGYQVGTDGREFGLQFYADKNEVKALRKEFKKKKTAAMPLELADIIQLLQTVDFGHGTEEELEKLEQVSDLLSGIGIEPIDVDLAIENFKTDPEKAKAYIYGPSGRGSNLGALKDLQNILEKEKMSKSAIMYRGAVYVPVEENPVSEQIRRAYNLPDDMDGVDICRTKDLDPKKDKEEQKYCTYDSKGKLRGRHKHKKDALRQKVFMINRYWQGKGKSRKDKPSNK